MSNGQLLVYKTENLIILHALFHFSVANTKENGTKNSKIRMVLGLDSQRMVIFLEKNSGTDI